MQTAAYRAVSSSISSSSRTMSSLSTARLHEHMQAVTDWRHVLTHWISRHDIHISPHQQSQLDYLQHISTTIRASKHFSFCAMQMCTLLLLLLLLYYQGCKTINF